LHIFLIPRYSTEITLQKQAKKDDASIKRFWDQYLEKLHGRGIKENVMKWYVFRVEQYINQNIDNRLVQHTKKDMEAYFQKISRDHALLPWQFYQLI